MKIPFAIAFATSLAFCAPAAAATAAASSPIEATQTCLSDSTSGKDRKLLAKWIFLAMAAHPEFKDLSASTAQDSEDTSREFAALVTRLMTVDCKAQMQALIAADTDAASALKLAFSHLGQVAMQELMNHKDVDASISRFTRYIDEEKLSSALGVKKGE